MTGPVKRVAAKFDFHVHSQYSQDARGTLAELAAQARRKGLAGFAVTDHNTFRMADEIRKSKIDDLLIIPGMEISTAQGHCIAVGIQAQVPHRKPLADTLDLIRDAGGVGWPSHPYRRVNGVGGQGLDSADKQLVAVEVFNARNGPGPINDRAAAYAQSHNLGGTGGSDAHQIFEVGNGYATFQTEPETVDDVVAQLLAKKTWGNGVGTPKHKMVLQNAKNAFLWARRGFKHM